MTIDPLSLLKNAQVFKRRFSSTMEQLKSIRAQGSAGGGIVKVELDGHFNMTSIALDPVAVDPRDIAMLQDLIVAAHHDAAEKIKAEIPSRIEPDFKEFSL